MALSIIIVNWNTGKLLTECLQSIYNHPPQVRLEVIVVDNASTDGSAVTAETNFPQAKIIHSQKNLGFAGGNNLGIEKSQTGCGDQVLLLNPDTVVHAGALQEMLVFLDEHGRAGAVGARLLNPDGSLQPSCSPEPTLRREFIRLFHLKGVRPDGYYSMDDWDITAPRLVDTLLGACIMVRREALDQVGLLDERFFMYSEEVDFCTRLRKSGWEIYWTPQAEVVHYGGQSTRLVAAEMFLNLYQAKVQYFRKHRGMFHAMQYKLILLAAGLARVSLTPAAWMERGNHRAEHLALIRQYRQLLRALPGM